MEQSLGQNPPLRPANTVFWGGGTPGLLPPSALARLGRAVLKANGGIVPEEWTVEMAPATVKRANPGQISTLCLTFEEDTALWLRLQKNQVVKTTADDEAAYFDRSWELLAAGGYEQYEISNYARPGHACRHNIDTWRMQEWIGYGPSASSQFGGRRWTEPHSIDEWLEGVATGRPKFAEVQQLTSRTLLEDSLIFGLRMNEGVDLDLLAKRYGQPLPEAWLAFQASLIESGLAALAKTTLCLSPEGRLVADRIAEEILDRFPAD